VDSRKRKAIKVTDEEEIKPPALTLFAGFIYHQMHSRSPATGSIRKPTGVFIGLPAAYSG